MEDTIALIERAHSGDKSARDTLVSENLGLVWSVVRRFGGRGYELEDLYQIGCIGLIKAIDKFDTAFQVKLSTYCIPMIMGEIRRFLRDDGMIKVSRGLKEIGAKAYQVKEGYIARYNREPTVEELAGLVGVTTEELVMAIDANSRVESLYKTIYENDGNTIYLLDKLDLEDDYNEEIVNRETLKKLMEELGELERRIIIERYFCDKTQTEIAKELGISQVQVSRIEKKTLIQMKSAVNTT